MSDRYDQLEAELLDMRRRIRRLTATNVLLAVVVLAFGGAGAAYAVAAANSVNSASIIDGSITTPDMKDGALSGSKVLDNALTGADVNESTLVPTCPTHTTRAGDVCFGPEHAADYFNEAMSTCQSAKMHLPSPGVGTFLTSVASGSNTLWTDAVFREGTASTAVITIGVGEYYFDDVGNQHAYRCITNVGARP